MGLKKSAGTSLNGKGKKRPTPLIKMKDELRGSPDILGIPKRFERQWGNMSEGEGHKSKKTRWGGGVGGGGGKRVGTPEHIIDRRGGQKGK